MSTLRGPALPLLVYGFVLVFFSLSIAGAEEHRGVVAGYDSTNGQVLLGELNCVACHKADDTSVFLLPKHAPDLSKVGERVTPQYLLEFLARPHAAKTGTPMPDVLHEMGEGERRDTVEKLAHYLVSLHGPIDQQSSGSSQAEIHRGEELFHTVGCVACHRPIEPPPEHKIDEGFRAQRRRRLVTDEAITRNSVPLPNLAKKTTVDALDAFISDPLTVRPSGRMPHLNLEPGQPRAIAAYLLREQYTPEKKAPGTGLGFAYYQGKWGKLPDFSKLEPKHAGQLAGVDLQAVLDKVEAVDGKRPKNDFAVRYFGMIDVPENGTYRFWTKSDDGSILWIGGKKVIDNDGLHGPSEKQGEIELTAGPHEFELGFFQQGGGFEFAAFWQPPGGKRSPIPGGVLRYESAAMIPQGIVDFKVDEEKATQGKKLFAELGCAACHKTGEKYPPAPTAPKLAELAASVDKGCLADEVPAKLPKFDLTGPQRAALREAVAAVKGSKPLSPKQKVHYAMNALNCYACHVREEFGGPTEERSNYFVYEKLVDLGDEGRLPPPLHEVGAKLTDEGFDNMLVRGQKYRTYMATRMPLFGKENVWPLVEWLRAADADKIAAHKPKFSPKLVDEGRFLIGKKGLSCINCHAWGEYRVQGAEGMDLLESPRRLTPGWFHAWLYEPQQLRRGTRMPTAWPDGNTFFPQLQDGDVHAQIDSVWAYLSVGEKGGFPPGLSPTGGEMLQPDSEPIVFRTFLDKVSAHAILVGFRQRTHMAFDANRVRSVVAWTGSFIATDPAWSGRAGQYAKIPGGNVAELPEGPPLAQLESLSDPWPADVAKTKERGSSRTPEGWRFRGYRFDDDRNVTFRYKAGPVEVEESPSTEYLKEAALLRRHFRVSASSDVPNLYFLVAAGQEIVENDGEYAVDNRLRFRIDSPASAKPLIREATDGKELLLPIELVKVNGKEETIEFTVDMRW